MFSIHLPTLFSHFLFRVVLHSYCGMGVSFIYEMRQLVWRAFSIFHVTIQAAVSVTCMLPLGVFRHGRDCMQAVDVEYPDVAKTTRGQWCPGLFPYTCGAE